MADTDRERPELNQLFAQFAYLQFLDLMTTLVFLINGVQEANPVVRFIMTRSPDPLSGLVALKVFAILLGLWCWRMGRLRLLSRINLLFALVVAWNLVALMLQSARSA